MVVGVDLTIKVPSNASESMSKKYLPLEITIVSPGRRLCGDQVPIVLVVDEDAYVAI